jgi:hypothetical protein
MDLMSMEQETAYRRLYRWVRNECKNLDSEAPDIQPLMRAAIGSLRARPVLLGYCLDEVASTRSKMVVQNFLIALTKGGPNGI